MKQILWVLTIFYLNHYSVTAHGPVHEAIIELTKEIESTPDSIFLYFERGALYKIDEDFDRAITDFEQVLSMDTSIHSATFQLADIYFKKRDFLKSSTYTNSYIKIQPNQAAGYQLRGRLKIKQGQVEAAVPDFKKVIQLKGKRIVPGEVLQLSQLLNIRHPRQAIEMLEYGLEILPVNISLTASLIDLTIATGNYQKAMYHVDQILSTLPRKEFWLLKKAEVFEAMGDCQLAKTTYHQSLLEIASLKRKSKQTKFVKNIQQQALFALQYL